MAIKHNEKTCIGCNRKEYTLEDMNQAYRLGVNDGKMYDFRELILNINRFENKKLKKHKKE